MKKKKCPHCDYDCPEDLFESHLKVCDENPEGKKYIPKLGFWDKFSLSPIATCIFIVSLCLAIFLKGGIWYLLAGFSLVWIAFKKADYDAGVDIK